MCVCVCVCVLFLLGAAPKKAPLDGRVFFSSFNRSRGAPPPKQKKQTLLGFLLVSDSKHQDVIPPEKDTPI